MSDTAYKAYFKRNLKKVIAKFGDIARLDEVAEVNLASALATKINNKADSSTVTALSGRVDTLVGNESGDDAKSARNIAAEEVAKIVANAPESYNTLKEIADWISTHAESASAMNSAIIALQGKTVLGTYVPDGEADPVEYATVKAYVEAYVADQIANNITLASLSVASATGSGNVITGLSYDSSTGAFTPTKGISAIELDDLSVETATGDGNVITGFSYDNTTGEFTPNKGITALEAGDISGTATGNGNVVTGFSYDSATGAFTATKGDTAVMENDLVDLTDSEIDALFVAETPGSGD